jgi:hypothetical protein
MRLKVAPHGVGSGLIHKYFIRLERLARDKRSSIFALIVSDKIKKPF